MRRLRRTVLRASVPWLSATPPRRNSPRFTFHGDLAEALVEPLDLDPERMSVLAFAVDQRFQSRPGVLCRLPVAAGTIVAERRNTAPTFGILDFLSPQSEVSQSSSLSSRAPWTMPVHRRGSGSAFTINDCHARRRDVARSVRWIRTRLVYNSNVHGCR